MYVYFLSIGGQVTNLCIFQDSSKSAPPAVTALLNHKGNITIVIEHLLVHCELTVEAVIITV